MAVTLAALWVTLGDMSTFVEVRDVAVAIGHSATCLTVEQLDVAIAEADRAQTLGPILDPTLSMAAGGSLNEQLRYLRAFRTFRAAIEELRP
jgi:hypothetical protein